MDRKGFYSALLCVLWVSLALLTANLSFAQGQEQVTSKELQEVVDLMEDPQKREIFLKNLKSVIQAQDAAREIEKKPIAIPARKEREVLVIETLFSRFDSISRDIMGATASTVSILTQTPSAFGKAKSFLSHAENRAKMLRLLGGIVVGIVIALILRFLLRGVMPRITSGMRDLASKVTLGFFRMILVSVPYVALIGALFLLFRMFPSFPLAHSLTLLFFGVLFLYRLALELFRVLLSPDDKGARLLPLGDENANYAWVWALRFIHYTAFYTLLTRILVLVEIPDPAYAFIRTLLLLVFPLMISVFIMQISQEIRVKYEKSRKGGSNVEEGSQKWTNVVIRYWAALAIAYAWAVFLFLIVQYERGFHYLFKATLGTAITLVALLPALGTLGWMFKKFFLINEKVKARFPGLEEKTNRYILILRKAFRWILIIVALGVIAQVWGIPISRLLASKTGSSMILRALAILITLGVVMAIIETSDYLKEYLLKSKRGKKKKEISQKRKTLLPMINTAVKIAAGFIGGIVILGQLGVNTTPILAGAGIIGLAVGFGSQTLVKDLINGLFILFEGR